MRLEFGEREFFFFGVEKKFFFTSIAHLEKKYVMYNETVARISTICSCWFLIYYFLNENVPYLLETVLNSFVQTSFAVFPSIKM